MLQQFVVATGVSLETTNQEKANWVEAYVDQIDPQIFLSLSRGRGSKPHPPAQMFKLAVYQILKRHRSPAKWAREVLSDTILQGLIGCILPSRTALYNFCDRIGKIIDRINQSLILQSIKYEILSPTVGVLLIALIERFLERPAQPANPGSPVELPPGSPIGNR